MPAFCFQGVAPVSQCDILLNQMRSAVCRKPRKKELVPSSG
nr:MAG TPA: hypothetical protein [Caudoviricetes sp.]